MVESLLRSFDVVLQVRKHFLLWHKSHQILQIGRLCPFP